MAIQRMATSLRFEDIDKLQHIQNVPIKEIERRARPGVFAASGFLGAKDRFKDVLKKDWQTVQSLGCTHIELAKQLRKIWNQEGGWQTFTGSKIGWSDRFSVRLGAGLTVASLVAGVALSSFAFLSILPVAYFLLQNQTTQSLHVEIVHHRGVQEDLFDPEGSRSNGWNKLMKLSNPITGAQVTVGEGVIDYIEKYGFYEGGDNNKYRVDPVKLLSILTGALPSTVAGYLPAQR